MLEMERRKKFVCWLSDAVGPKELVLDIKGEKCKKVRQNNNLGVQI